MFCLLHSFIYLNLHFVCKDGIFLQTFYLLSDLLEFKKNLFTDRFYDNRTSLTLKHFFIKMFFMVKILHELQQECI